MTSKILACVTGCSIKSFSKVQHKLFFLILTSLDKVDLCWGKTKSSRQGSKAVIQSNSQMLAPGH